MESIYDYSYNQGKNVALTTNNNITDNNCADTIICTFIDMLAEENEPCGCSFNFDAWWNGFFNNLNIEQTDFIGKLKKAREDFYKWESNNIRNEWLASELASLQHDYRELKLRRQ